MSDGTKFIGAVDGDIVSFRGLRYAEPPTGNLRWKAPIMRNNYGGQSINLKNLAPGCQTNMADSRRRRRDGDGDQSEGQGWQTEKLSRHSF